MAVTCRYYEEGHYRHVVPATHVTIRGFTGVWNVLEAEALHAAPEFCLRCAGDVQTARNRAARQAQERTIARRLS